MSRVLSRIFFFDAFFYNQDVCTNKQKLTSLPETFAVLFWKKKRKREFNPPKNIIENKFDYLIGIISFWERFSHIIVQMIKQQ